MLQKLKPAFIWHFLISIFLLSVSMPMPLQAQELQKADPGKCPDGYLELSVGIGPNGENCVFKGDVVQKVDITDPNHPETIVRTGEKCPDGYEHVGKDKDGKEKCAPDKKVCPDPDKQDSISEEECVIKS